jgi:hypothetical protein
MITDKGRCYCLILVGWLVGLAIGDGIAYTFW